MITMKKITLLVAVLMLSFSVFSQEKEEDQLQTILGDEISISGFGGPWMSFTSINGEYTHMMGGGGGVLLNQSLYLGGYGYGNTNPISYEPGELEFGYGGLMAGYIHESRRAIHPNLGVMIGWGDIRLNETGLKDNIFVLQPMAEVETNITRFMKIGLGVGYRYVTGVNALPGLNNKNFSGLNGRVSFYFGWFD
jgi:hypothetical protein